jgi:hypothetical protein
MFYFVQATEQEMSMHARIQYLNLQGFLWLIPTRFVFLEFYMEQ